MRSGWTDRLRTWIAIPDPSRFGVSSTPPVAEMRAQPGHVPGLNGWRALSVILVLVTHTLGHAGLGNFGVLVFFVISGFLITRLFLVEYERTGAIAVGDFFRRRILRLYPAVVTYTAIVVIVYLIWMPDRFNVLDPACALLYCENYLVAHRLILGQAITMPFYGFWSLSIEEHFYIVFPLLLITLMQNSRDPVRHLLWLGAAATILPLLARIIYVTAEPRVASSAFDHFIYARTETRIDSIATGILIAAACETERGRALVRALTNPRAVGLALAAILAWHAVPAPLFRETIGYTVLNAAAAALLCATMFSNRYGMLRRLLNTRVSDWIGRLSYSIYVWHFGILDLTFRVLPPDDRWVRFLVVVVLTPVVACASFYGPEGLARRWRDARGARGGAVAYTLRV